MGIPPAASVSGAPGCIANHQGIPLRPGIFHGQHEVVGKAASAKRQCQLKSVFGEDREDPRSATRGAAVQGGLAGSFCHVGHHDCSSYSCSRGTELKKNAQLSRTWSCCANPGIAYDCWWTTGLLPVASARNFMRQTVHKLYMHTFRQ